MDRYTARLNLRGSSYRERMKNRLKDNLQNKALNSLSCKTVLLNGIETQLVINSGTQPYYKEFQTLPGQLINIGDYVEWENSHWLVVSCDYDDELYQDGQLKQCNYLLKWQNDKGEIIERYAVIQSASKYNDGTTSNGIITLGSDQLSVVLPLDKESIRLKKDMGIKFFIDNNKVDPTTYELTGTGNVPDTYNGHGVTSWIVKECAYTATKDDLKYGVCNYRNPHHPPLPPSHEIPVLKTTEIRFKGKPELRAGGNYKSFVGVFRDKEGNDLTTIGKWEVVTIDELLPYIQYAVSDNSIKIKVTDDEITIGGKVRLIFSDKNNNTSTYVDLNILNSF